MFNLFLTLPLLFYVLLTTHTQPLYTYRYLLPYIGLLPMLYTFPLSTTGWLILALTTFGILLFVLPDTTRLQVLHYPTLRFTLLVLFLLLLPPTPLDYHSYTPSLYDTTVLPIFFIALLTMTTLLHTLYPTLWSNPGQTTLNQARVLRLVNVHRPATYILVLLLLVLPLTGWTPLSAWYKLLALVLLYSLLLFVFLNPTRDTWVLLLYTTLMLIMTVFTYHHLRSSLFLTICVIQLLEQHSYLVYRLVGSYTLLVQAYTAVQFLLSFFCFVLWFLHLESFTLLILMKLGLSVLAVWIQLLYAELPIPPLLVYTMQAYFLLAIQTQLFASLSLYAATMNLLYTLFGCFVLYLLYSPYAHFVDHSQPLVKWLTATLAVSVFVSLFLLLTADYTSLTAWLNVSAWQSSLILLVWLHTQWHTAVLDWYPHSARSSCNQVIQPNTDSSHQSNPITNHAVYLPTLATPHWSNTWVSNHRWTNIPQWQTSLHSLLSSTCLSFLPLGTPPSSYHTTTHLLPIASLLFTTFHRLTLPTTHTL